MAKKEPELVLRLELTVRYQPYGVDPTYLAENLRQMVHQAMGNGTITGDSEAEVVEHDLRLYKLRKML